MKSYFLEKSNIINYMSHFEEFFRGKKREDRNSNSS